MQNVHAHTWDARRHLRAATVADSDLAREIVHRESLARTELRQGKTFRAMYDRYGVL